MVPKGMASLKNLVKLNIHVEEFDKEGLRLLMGMPFLANLMLRIKKAIKENLTVSSSGFKLLKVFFMDNFVVYRPSYEMEPTNGLRLTFAPGAVPVLWRLHLLLSPMVVASDFFANLGLEHFPSLANLVVGIDCREAPPGRVEALESSIEKATDLHPNREMEINVGRGWEDDMFNDDREWEDAVRKERKGWEEACEKLAKSREEDKKTRRR